MKFLSRLAALSLIGFVAANAQQVRTAKQTVTTIAKGKTVSVVTRQVRVLSKPAPAKSPVSRATSATVTLRTTGSQAVGNVAISPAVPAASKKIHPNLFPGYPNATISSQSFGSTAVGGTSATVTLSYPYPAGVTEQIFTFASGLNGFFGEATCNYPQPCTAPIAFQPTYPGLTTNAVISKDQNGNVIYETMLYATGTGPQFGFDLGDLTVHTGVTNQPDSLALGPDGSLYLTDASQNLVYQIASGFSSQTALVIVGLGTPGGIAVDGAGTLYISDKSHNVIVAYNVGTGTQSTLTTSQLSNPTGVGVDFSGALYIADTGNGRIIKIDNLGNETSVLTGLDSPTSLAVDTQGDVFFADAGNGGEVTVLSQGIGNNAVTIGTQLGTLYDIAVDAAERVYIGTPTGETLISPFGTMVQYGGGANYGIAVDPAGNFYTTQPGNGSVAVTNRSASNFILSSVVETTTTGGDTISNTGNTTMTLSNIAITGGTVFTDDDSDQCVAGLTLPPGKSCNTLVDFTPAAAQNYTESYTVTSNSLNVTSSTNVDTLYGDGIGVATSTALSISPSPAMPGQAVTFTATVNQQGETELPNPTGTVNFIDGTTPLGSGTLSGNTAQFSTANLTPGTHSITAMYAGDNNNSASASPAQSLLVTLDYPSTTTLGSTPNSPRVGQSVAFSIAVSGQFGVPTGTVTLMNNAIEPGTVLGTVTIDGNGNASFSTIHLVAGLYDIVATYNGDPNYSPSSSSVDSFTVSPPIATNTTLTASPATVAYEGNVTLSANVYVQDNLTSGQVIFCSTAAIYCNATLNLGTAQVTSNGHAVLTVGSGTIGSHSYTAIYLGGNGYGTSTSTAQTVTVTGNYPTTTAISATPLGATSTSAGYVLTATVVGTGTNASQPRGSISFIDTSDPNATPTQGELGFATFGFALAQPTGSPIGVGSAPYGVATGDFNGDGFQDVVVENYEGDTVSVLLGNGDGTFQPQVTYAVGILPERVLVADLNGDGFLDLVVANTGGATVSVLLGNGDGTFQQQVTYQCGSPVGLGVMDINHDGYPDVVVGDYYDNTISVLLGNGDGTLQPAVTYATGSTPQTVAEGDFNGDGNIDIAVGNEGGATVGIFLGNGDGTFQSMVTYAVGSLPMGVQVGDFNNDGKQDLAVSNQGDGTVSVLLGNGDGTFQAQVTYPVGVQPVGLAIADFNGDGIEDITVGNTGQASLTQSVLLGNGDGTFQAQVTFPAGNFPYGVAVADFNGDGLPDMAIADYSDGNALILLSKVTATATGGNSLTVGGGPNDIHNVEAMFPGAFSFAASTSPTIALPGGVVTAASTTTLAITPAAPTVGQNVTFSVAVTGATPVATGTVTLMNTAVSPATVLGTITLGSAGTGTFSTNTLAAGTYNVTAAYSGDSNYSPSTSSVEVLTIAPAAAAPNFVSNIGTPLAAQPVGVFLASAGTVQSVQVLTQGVTGLDFTMASGGTCATGTAYTVGQYCTVNVVFNPQHAGTRTGAVLLLDANNQTLGVTYLPGSGLGPQIIYGAGTQTVLGGGLSSPEGLGLDGAGNVYVADLASGFVKEIPLGCTSAACVKTLASGFMYPNGLAVDGAGNVFFDDFSNSNDSNSSTSDNFVEEIPFGCTSASCFRTLGSGFILPDSIAVDLNGNVFVSDFGNNAVKELVAVNGVVPASPTINILAGGFTGQTGPDGLTLDPSGNIYVTDHDDGHALYEIPIAGGYSTLNTISSSFTAPEDVKFDGTGNAYVVDEDTNSLYELPATNGSLPAPPTINTLAADFNSPEGVAVDGLGNVYVSDYGNQRVVKIDYSDPTTLNFATATTVGSTDTADGPQKVTVRNNGNAALAFTAIVPSTNFTLDSGTTTCSTTAPLAAGSSCVVGVDFAPTVAGNLSGTLTLTDNARNVTGASQSVPLTGIGTAAPPPLAPSVTTLAITPAAATVGQNVTFSVAVTGATPVATGTVTLMNTAVTPASILGTITLGTAGTGIFSTTTLTAATYSVVAIYSGDSNYSASTSTAHSLVVSLASQTITFPAIPNHAVGDAPFTLSATASSGLAVTYAVTAGPATVAASTVTLTGAGTVTIQATQAGNTTYAAATPVSRTFTVSAVPPPTASSISPAGVVAGSAATTITLTGANFTATDVIHAGGTALPTTFVNATTLTAVIPASFFAAVGTVPITVVDTATNQASGAVNFTVAVAPVVVFTGPATATSDEQPMVTFQLKQPYAVPINCLLTLTFAPSTSTGIDDPTVQFSSGGRTINFTVPAGSTTTPAVLFQTGTVAGTVTVTLGIVADDVDVTPANVAPIVVVLPEVVPQVASATLSRTGSGTTAVLTVTLTGFSNTREVKSAIFHFTPTPGNTIADPDVTVDASTIFAAWYGSGPSDAYGSSFTYTQPFNLNSDPSTVQSVTVTLVNGVGTSVAQTTE